MISFRKIISTFIYLFIIFCFSIFCFYPTALSKTRKKTQEIKLLTTNLNRPYKVIGVVVSRSGAPDLAEINNKLKKQAKELNADYVIGINYVTYAGYLFAYGTAVKIVEIKTKTETE